MPENSPVVFGSAGLGGYAGSICNLLERAAGDAAFSPPVRLAAVCEPDHVTHAARIAELRAKGVRVHQHIDGLLAEREVEAVWLPLPIDLHRPFTEKALAAGKAVMCEKPAAGAIDDLFAMIAARDRAKLPAAIGYQDVYDPTTLPLKRRILRGDLGRVTHATVRACWPRNQTYYNRANWAGRFKRNGAWVMDSPPNNALAHYLNIPLFLLGPDETSSAIPVAVEAELYRVNPIENFDTVSMRLTLPGGVTLLVLFTHACQVTHHPVVTIHGARGTAVRTNSDITLTIDGKTDAVKRPADTQAHMLSRFAKFVRGTPDDGAAVATFEVASAQLIAVNGASEATPIHQVGAPHTVTTVLADAPLQAIVGIEDAFLACAAENRMLHESKRVAWSRPAGSRNLVGYRHFAGPKLGP